MQRQVQYLTDRAEITGLMDRYLRSLDAGAFDEERARAFRTDDVAADLTGAPCARPRGVAGVTGTPRAGRRGRWCEM